MKNDDTAFGPDWNKIEQAKAEAPFLDFHISVANEFISSNIYDKRNDFDFDILKFRFWMVTFLGVLLMVYTFRNLLGLQESEIMLRTSTRVINVKHSTRVINI